MAFVHPSIRTPQSGFVLFSQGAPAASEIADALRPEFGDAVEVRNLSVPGKGEIATVVVAVDAATALLGTNDAPLDTEPTLRACHPVWWQGETAPVENHRSHVVLTVLHPGDKPAPRAQAIQESTVFSVVATQLARIDGAVAVLSSNTSTCFPADAYARAFTTAVEAREVPADLWTSVWVLPEADGSHSAYTLGLDTFGHADLVVEHSRRSPAELYGFVSDVARYVLTSGAVFEPGQTVGPTASEQRPLRARHSSIHGREVLEIGDLPRAV